MRSPRVDLCDLYARAGSRGRAARPRAAVLGLLLVLLAACSTTLLCTWHCATFHDDGAVARVIGQQADDGDPLGTPLHAAAHIACHGFTGPAGIGTAAVAMFAVASWPDEAWVFLDGITVAAVLRPPRG